MHLPCRVRLGSLALGVAFWLAPGLSAHPKARTFDVRDVSALEVRVERMHRGAPIRKVVEDERGVLWGVNGVGALLLRLPNSRRWVTEHCPSRADLTPGNFTDLVPWGPRLVLGSPFSGLVLHSAGSWKPLVPRGTREGSLVRDFLVHQEELWVAAADGIWIHRPEDLRRRSLPLPEDLAGTPSGLASNGSALIVATDAGGLALHEHGDWEILALGEPGTRRPVRAMIADGGRVLLGGAGWLEEWRLMGGHHDILASNPSLGRLVISDLALEDGVLWVATIGQGVLHRKDGRWGQLLPPFADLGATSIYGLTPLASGTLLASHSQGLTRITVEAP